MQSPARHCAAGLFHADRVLVSDKVYPETHSILRALALAKKEIFSFPRVFRCGTIAPLQGKAFLYMNLISLFFKRL